MDITLIQLSASSLALVPVVLALTSLLKSYIEPRWSPLISIGLGIAGAFLVPAITVPLTILQGVLIGVTASGIYSGGKAVFTS